MYVPPIFLSDGIETPPHNSCRQFWDMKQGRVHIKSRDLRVRAKDMTWNACFRRYITLRYLCRLNYTKNNGVENRVSVQKFQSSKRFT